MSFVKRVAGAAIRFIAEDTAEIRFSWEGVWEAGQTLQPLGMHEANVDVWQQMSRESNAQNIRWGASP